jgi:tetratricopeptide (TPR) repeat protein
MKHRYLLTAAVLAGLTAWGAPEAREETTMDIYRDPAVVAVPDWQFQDLPRFMGRRDQYEKIDLAAAIEEGLGQYFDRRVAFEGRYWRYQYPPYGGTERVISAGLDDAEIDALTAYNVQSAPARAERWSLLVAKWWPPLAETRGVEPPPSLALGAGGIYFVAEATAYGFAHYRRRELMHQLNYHTAQLVSLELQAPVYPSPTSAEPFLEAAGRAGEEEAVPWLLLSLQVDPAPAVAREVVERLERLIGQARQESRPAKKEYVWLGEVHEWYMGDLEKAALAYERAHRDHEQVPGYQGMAVLGQGRCLERLGRTDPARELYLEHIRKYPRDLWVTDLLDRLAGLGVVVDPVELGMALPSERRQRIHAALELFNRGDHVGAFDAMQEIARRDPRDAWARLYLAVLAPVLGRVEEGNAAISSLTETLPPLAQVAPSMVLPWDTGLDQNSPFYSDAQRVLGRWRHSGSRLALILARDRNIDFPEDVIAHLVPLIALELEDLPKDMGAGFDDLVAVAGNAIPVRLHQARYLRSVIREDDNYERLQDTRRWLVAQDESRFWSFHRVLAQGPETPERLAHRIRYEELQRNPPVPVRR